MPPKHQPSSLRPLTLAVLLALAGPLVIEPAQAQASNTSVQSYDLPAGPLDATLTRIARQAGRIISIDPAMVGGLKAAPVRGRLTLAQAFDQALAGSGLALTVSERGTLGLKRMPRGNRETTLPVVTVIASAAADGNVANAYRSKSAGVGVLGNKALKDTPYSIEAYSRELMDNKQARSLAEATKGDASISLASGNLVTENNSLAIRGISPDFYTGKKIDGMNTRVRADDLPLEHFERVEILKGAGAFLYGFGAPGGVVNHVLKRATDDPVRSLGLQFMDSGLALVHGDVGGRVGAAGGFGYRVNVVHESGDTYINGGESRRSSGSIALDWRITPDLVWRVDALAGKHTRDGGYWALVPNASGAANDWSAAKPLAPIDGSKRLAPSFTRYGSRHETYGTDLTWQFAPDWKLLLAHRESENGRKFLAPALFANAQGDYAMTFWNYANLFESSQSQGMITGRLVTGPVTHDLSVGVSRTRTRSSNSRPSQSAIVGSGNLSDPVDFANPFTRYQSYGDVNTEYDLVRQREIFASDTLHLGSDLDLIIGLRRGSLDNQYADYDKSETTPTLAAVYRPVPGLSIYASYVEALEEGGSAPETAANAGEIFPPLVSKQHEVGAKAEGADWGVSAALFRLQRGLTYTTPSNVFTQDGEARYQGLELAGKARLGRQWLVTASAMWLDATNQKTTSGSLDGKHIQGVARQQASLYGEHRVAGLPLTLSAGVRYIGKRPIDAANQWHVDAVTLVDVGARYETELAGKPLILRINVDNLADKAYWVTQASSSYLIQGAPLTVKLGAQIDF